MHLPLPEHFVEKVFDGECETLKIQIVCCNNVVVGDCAGVHVGDGLVVCVGAWDCDGLGVWSNVNWVLELVFDLRLSRYLSW